MKAQVITEFGDPSVFQMMDLPKPVLKSGHVLIRVCATSVNQIDCKIRRGLVPDIAPDFPAVLHGDVAGIIEAVAPDVKNFKLGDEVYGCAGGIKSIAGALADFMLADVKLLAKKPTSLTMVQAAALPLVSITAWEALFKKAQLKKDETILVQGGVGGVGHIAVQLAKGCDAKVYATVRKNEDVKLAKTLGADEVINVEKEKIEDAMKQLVQNKGFNIVFDTVGGNNLNQSLNVAALEGTIVTTNARVTLDLTPLHSKGLNLEAVFMLLPLLTNRGREEHGKILSQITNLVDQGQLIPLIDPHVFSLENISEAHALVESGLAKGKVVIAIS